jgi:riboflavin biosynthesis pyrimidine reductase
MSPTPTSATLYSATMSLDGFIAGPGGDMSWLTDHLGPNPVADDLVARVGALLIGNRTFRGDDPNAGTDHEGAFGGLWHGPQFVLTHHPPAAEVPGVRFVDDVVAGVAAARAAADGRYVNVLGAEAARSCLAAGLLDEVLVLVAPVLLGDGVRLFDHPGGSHVRLEPVHQSVSGGIANLWYRVRRDAQE